MRYDVTKKLQGVRKMLLSLEQIFTFIAKDKGIKNQSEWVAKKLEHCEVHSDYLTYVHLRSHNRMWFGVKDNKFECKDFILYREYKNTDETREIKEFELYTFSSIADFGKLDFFFRESYQYNYDIMKEFRLYFQTAPVKFKVLLPDGSVAKLGKYNDLDNGYCLKINIYTVRIANSTLPPMYCKTEEQLVLKILELRELCKPIQCENISDGEPTFYDTTPVEVKCNDKRVNFKLYKLDGEWKVDINNISRDFN